MAIAAHDIARALDEYLAVYPEDRASLSAAYSLRFDGADLASRREFRGHATAGAILLDPANRILHVHHRALGRWLLPGGHLETEDVSLQAAALRELCEETGYTASSVTAFGELPLHVDIHQIPANPAKDEPSHPHIDFRFAFRTSAEVGEVQTDEVFSAAWLQRTSLNATLQYRLASLLTTHEAEKDTTARAEAAVGAAAPCDPPVLQAPEH